MGSAECGELGRKCRPMKHGGDPDAEYDKLAILEDMITPGFMYKVSGAKFKDCVAFELGQADIMLWRWKLAVKCTLVDLITMGS